MRARRADAGITLMELMISITLLSLLSLGMVIAMRIGLLAYSKTTAHLMDNRRVAGAQRIVEQQLDGLIPVITGCGDQPPVGGNRMAFFEGEPDTIRLVSTFSLHQGWRGEPQILEMFVIPGEGGHGVRLVVNEIPYTGPLTAGMMCTGRTPDPEFSFPVPVFAAAQPQPATFVLADRLAYCRFTYLSPGGRPGPQADPNLPAVWRTRWIGVGWPYAVRLEMAPLESDPSHLQPITVTAPIHLMRSSNFAYAYNDNQ
jgi:hypothetical protein